MDDGQDFDFSDVLSQDFDKFWEPHSQSITMSYIERKAWDLHTEALAAEAKVLSELCRDDGSDEDDEDENLGSDEVGSFTEDSRSFLERDTEGDENALVSNSDWANGEVEEPEGGQSDADTSDHSSKFDPRNSPFVGYNHDIQHLSTPHDTHSSPRTPSTNREIIPPSTEREVYMALQSSPLSYLRPRRPQPIHISSSPYSASSQHSPPTCNQAHHVAHEPRGSLSSGHNHHPTEPVPSILNIEPQSPYSPYTLHADAPWAWDVRLRMYHIDTELQTVDTSSRIVLGQLQAYRQCLLAQRDRYHRLLTEGPGFYSLPSDVL